MKNTATERNQLLMALFIGIVGCILLSGCGSLDKIAKTEYYEITISGMSDMDVTTFYRKKGVKLTAQQITLDSDVSNKILQRIGVEEKYIDSELVSYLNTAFSNLTPAKPIIWMFLRYPGNKKTLFYLAPAIYKEESGILITNMTQLQTWGSVLRTSTGPGPRFKDSDLHEATVFLNTSGNVSENW